MIKIILTTIFLISSLNCLSNDYLAEVGGIFFNTYHNFISPTKQSVSNCQFEPSCSNYAENAIEDYGLFKGLLMFGDRFQRCSAGLADYNQYPIINGHFYDPPICNMIFGTENLWKLGLYTYNNKFKPISHIESNKEYSFAHSLFIESDYSSTILELKRLLFNTKDTLKIFPLLISTNLLKKNTKNAIDLVLELNAKGIISNKVFILTSVTTDIAGFQRWNINYLKSNHEKLNNDTLVKKFLIYNYLKLYDFEKARIESDSLNLEIEPIIEKLSNNVKSPVLAATLSTVIPGLGYFYCGESSEALSAFLINGLLGYSIYNLFNNKNYGSATLVSLISFPFYFGNIIGSANMAETINQKEHEYIFNEVRNEFKISFYFSFNYFDSLWNK